MFRRQERPWFAASAELSALSARRALGARRGRLADSATRLVEDLRRLAMPELPRALLLAGTLALPVDPERADRYLAEAASYRHDRLAITRALAWQATALRRQERGDDGGVVRACDVGLRDLDEHLALLGSSELRALATAHGHALADLGTRAALRSGDARRLLVWAERWRATALAMPPAVEQHDEETTRQLAVVRAQHRRVEQARAKGEQTDRLERQAGRHEQVVRQRLLRAAGTGQKRARFDVGPLLDALRDEGATFVELVEVDGTLYALVGRSGRVHRLRVGPMDQALRAQEFARFVIRQAGRGRPADLRAAGARLEQTMLGPAARQLGEGPVVISPSSRLQGTPWALAPSLAGRPLTSTPSARMWLRARTARAASQTRSFIVGPGLASGGGEVPRLAAADPAASVLREDASTVDAALAALDGAQLVHIAAHGHFREDSPLFSSLALADGPLMVYDLERLARPPHRVVLSACEAGVMKPVGGDELLGLAAALLSMGSAGVVSGLVQVNDAATVEVMVSLHAGLRAGAGLGESMRAARETAADDHVLAATAASFAALGV